MKLKTFINLILSVTMLGVFPAHAENISKYFPDTKNHWAKDYISELFTRGIVSGMEDGNFHPDENITTEQFTVMAMRSCKGDIAPTDTTWASGYLDYALSRNIIDSYDMECRYKPIERRHAAKIVHQTLITEYGEKNETDWRGAESLKDLYDCSSCVQNIAQVYAKGIMTGRTDTLFDNYGTLTRAEAAAVIVRMTDKDKRIIPTKKDAPEIKEISPDTAFAMLAGNSTAVLIDVRTADEYVAGHINGSRNIPLAEINKNPLLIGADKDAPVILYCSKGYKSSLAAQLLIDSGYTEIYTIPGIEQYNYDLVQ